MNLLDLCEPLFQYICRLNRAGRKSGQFEFAVARAEVKSLLDQIQSKAAGDPRLKNQAKAVELPLIFFVDSMIAESALPFAQEWHKKRLAYDRNELAGDEKFFDLLEETLRDSSEEASERLAVFYTCLGLGFTGWYVGQPEYLRKKMLEMATRIRHLLESDSTVRICPEAYENTDTRDLIEPPTQSIGAIAIGFVVLMLTTLAANYYLFHKASEELTDSLGVVLQQDKNLGQ
jgi:type IV/VI secretion system ImpK/VasF family protein